MDCNWRHVLGVGCLYVFASLYSAVIISMTQPSAWTVVGYSSLFLPGLMIPLLLKDIRSPQLTPGKLPRQLQKMLHQALRQVFQVLLRRRWHRVAFIFSRAAYVLLHAVDFLFCEFSFLDIIESAVISAFALIGASTLLAAKAYGDGQACDSAVTMVIGLMIPSFFHVYLFFFHSKHSPKQSREEGSIQAQKPLSDHSTPPLGRRSPIDIAILRSSDYVFYDWDQESLNKKLNEHFRESKAREVVIVRRLLSKEVDCAYEGPLPLLCQETVQNPRYTDEKAKTGDQEPNNPTELWLDVFAGGLPFTIVIYPLMTFNESGTLNYLLLNQKKVACGWEVYQGLLDEQMEREKISRKDLCQICVLPSFSVPSLKTCASFVVAHQFADNLDQLFGAIPSSLIADLKGR